MLVKKLLMCLLAVILASLLLSCGAEADEGKQTGSYLYTQIRGVLYKISTETATVTPLCPDPLCFHEDKSCPFYGVGESGINFTDRYIYYLKEYKVFEYMKKLCRFDIVSGEYEVLYEPEEGTLTDLFFAGEYLYFNHSCLEDDPNENGVRRHGYYICRYNIKSGKVEKLTDEVLFERQWPYGTDGERIYWSDFLNYYSTDINYENRIDGDITFSSAELMGDYGFRLEKSGFDTESFTQLFELTRVDLKTGEEITVFEDIGCFPILYGGKIIYSKLDDPVLLGYMYDEESGELKPHYDKWGGKYYICDSDGKNERLLCDITELGYEIPILTNIIGKTGVGDWIAVTIPFTVDTVSVVDGKNVIEYGDLVYLLINIKTGETKTAVPEIRS